jgi:L-lactate dehydrogenase
MKIGIVGCGNVGSSCAYACVLRGIGSEIILIDRDISLSSAQAEDILHATPFSNAMQVKSGVYEDLLDAQIVMVTAGVNQQNGETRLDLLKRNADVLRDVIPSILKVAPNAILIVASNPVDMMTHMTANIAHETTGHAYTRVIGSGTILDTARFRALIAQHLGVSSHSVHGYVLGEHGDSEVLHWSGVRVGNMTLENFAAQVNAPITHDVRSHIDDGVRKAAYRIIQGKGATWHGIGAAMARVAQTIANDESAVLTCSALHKEVAGISNVTLSIPLIISKDGIQNVLFPELTNDDMFALQKSAEIIKEATVQIGF